MKKVKAIILASFFAAAGALGAIALNSPGAAAACFTSGAPQCGNCFATSGKQNCVTENGGCLVYGTCTG